MRDRPFLLAAGLALALDQGTKVATRLWMTRGLPPQSDASSLQWCWVENPGAAFSMLADSPLRHPFFASVSFVTLVSVAWAQRSHGRAVPVLGVGLGLLGGGAAGNFVDRLLYRSVTDWVCVRLSGELAPPFNFADVAIAAGVLLAVLALLRPENPRDAGER